MNTLVILTCTLFLASESHGFGTAAFASPVRPRQCQQYTQHSNNKASMESSSYSLIVRHMAGFGSSDSNNISSAKKKKDQKLKPKQQWDRFAALKKETSVLVAVRVVGEEDWLEVGRVKSKDDANIAISLAKQRVIIAEHARRLFPLQVSKDAKVEWAYRQTEPDEKWIAVEKSVLNEAPDGIEKDIGFEGRPDPASGFYCLYNRGRLVDANSPNEGRV